MDSGFKEDGKWRWEYGIIVGDKLVGKYVIPVVHWQTGEIGFAPIGLYLIKETKGNNNDESKRI